MRFLVVQSLRPGLLAHRHLPRSTAGTTKPIQVPARYPSVQMVPRLLALLSRLPILASLAPHVRHCLGLRRRLPSETDYGLSVAMYDELRTNLPDKVCVRSFLAVTGFR